MADLKIIRPWIIVHEPEEDGKTVTIISGPKDVTHCHYGIVIADIVRHVARAFEVDEEHVWEWARKEMDRPTAKLTSGKLH